MVVCPIGLNGRADALPRVSVHRFNFRSPLAPFWYVLTGAYFRPDAGHWNSRVRIFSFDGGLVLWASLQG